MNTELQPYLLGKLRMPPAGDPAEWKQAAAELVQTNLKTLAAHLPRLLPTLNEAATEAVLQALVESQNPEVATILAALDSPLIPKSLRKSARRALHLLRTRGVQVDTAAILAAHVPSPQTQPEWHAWYTTTDNQSGQVWILEHKTRLRTDLYDIFIEEGILREVIYIDAATAKDRDNLLNLLQSDDQEGTPAPILLQEIDPDHARWRIFHAAEQTKKRKHPLPKEFAFARKTLQPPENSERHPVWRFFNSFDIRAEMQHHDPELEKRLHELQYRFWAHNIRLIDDQCIDQFMKMVNSPIELPPDLKQKKEDEIFQAFADRRLDEYWLDYWKWALQDFAYAWYKRGWRQEASLVLYWSLSMDSLNLEQNPFLRIFLRNSITFYLMLMLKEQAGEEELEAVLKDALDTEQEPRQ